MARAATSRERTSQLVVEAQDGLRQVGAEEWDPLLTPGQAGLRHAYLSAWERVRLRRLRSRPLVVYGNESLLVAAPGYHYDLDLALLTPAWVATTAGLLRRLWPRFLRLSVYELGGPVALSDPILTSLGRGQAAELLLGEAVAEAEREHASLVIVQDFAERRGDVPAQLAAAGFLPVQIPPTVLLELPFESFEAYLAAMRAQYRRRARRVMELSGGLRVERRREFADLAPQLAHLAQMVFRRASEVRREILTSDYFCAASEDEHLSVLMLVRRDGSIASFALLLDDPPWLYFLNCGFEEPAGREEGAYFRLLYEIVRLGIEEGFEHVNLGTTTVAPKLDLGGVAVPLLAWVRAQRPAVQRIAELAAPRMFPPRSVEHRNVFRSPYDSLWERWAGRGEGA